MIGDLKSHHPAIALSRICGLLGITRQGFYQHGWDMAEVSLEEQLVLCRIREIRNDHPAMGGRKLYFKLQAFLMDHQIKMGRDKLFNLLAVNRLLIRRRKRMVSTTQSHHWLFKHPNLIRDWHPTRPNQLWVSDITYIPAARGFLYLSLVTDAYSHKIMGYAVADNLDALNSIGALKMALSNLRHKDAQEKLIHHSDRGVQYCSSNYVQLLNQNDIQISMTESGDPLENPLAERINGILKYEYINHYPRPDLDQAGKMMERVVNLYNCDRPHQSINLCTPEEAHEKMTIPNRNWGRKSNFDNLVNLYQD